MTAVVHLDPDKQATVMVLVHVLKYTHSPARKPGETFSQFNFERPGRADTAQKPSATVAGNQQLGYTLACIEQSVSS